LSTASLNIIATPVIDSIEFDCIRGEAQVYVSNIPDELLYSVMYTLPSSVSIPPANHTGRFNLKGASEADFRVSNQGCYADSLLTVNCGDTLLDNSLLIYPNPADKELFVRIIAGRDIRFKGIIYNSLSQVVIDEFTFDAKEGRSIFRIDLGMLAAGAYHLVYRFGNSPKPGYFKFVKLN
jgi:hypothetical protein